MIKFLALSLIPLFAASARAADECAVYQAEIASIKAETRALLDECLSFRLRCDVAIGALDAGLYPYLLKTMTHERESPMPGSGGSLLEAGLEARQACRTRDGYALERSLEFLGSAYAVFKRLQERLEADSEPQPAVDALLRRTALVIDRGQALRGFGTFPKL